MNLIKTDWIMKRNMSNEGLVTRSKWKSKVVPTLLKDDKSERLPVLKGCLL